MLEIRKDFPILDVPVHNKPFVYLDNAATTLKPNQVVDRMSDFMKSEMSNIHRGVHYYSEKATKSYEAVRTKIKKWINANSTREICFTSGATHSLNQFAISYAEKFLREGDEVIISYMEHHSNIVPWQILRDKKKLIIKVIPINDNGELELEAFEKLITNKTKLLSVVYISNSLGTINPIEEMVKTIPSKKYSCDVRLCSSYGTFPH